MSAHEDFSRVHEFKVSSNRGFGWVFTGVFSIVGLRPLIHGGEVRWWSLTIAALLMLLTLVSPAAFAVPNRLWLRFGLLLNRVMSPVALAVLFYAVVTPIGILKRFFGQDTLRLRRNDVHETYWIRRDPPGPKPDSMGHQF